MKLFSLKAEGINYSFSMSDVDDINSSKLGARFN